MMERYGYAIFCNDIRNEPGGKLTFVGCYNAVMFTEGEYPIVLPKFCIHFQIFSPATQPYRSVFARCYIPGEKDPIAEEPIEVPSFEDQKNLLDSLQGRRRPAFHRGCCKPGVCTARDIKATLIHIRALINSGPGELHLVR